MEIADALIQLNGKNLKIKPEELESVLKEVFNKKIFIEDIFNFGIHDMLDHKS